MSSQMANFLDQAGGLWAKGALHGKVGGAFTSTATQHGGQETTLFSIITNLLHFGMTIVGLNYGFARPDEAGRDHRRLTLRRDHDHCR
jgi:NAD(P)H dehydrogenase (quinone)